MPMLVNVLKLETEAHFKFQNKMKKISIKLSQMFHVKQLCVYNETSER